MAVSVNIHIGEYLVNIHLFSQGGKVRIKNVQLI